MATEIYFNKELADISFEVEALDEWKETCKELGLNKQLLLSNGKGSPIPYPYINEAMRRVYATLCPRTYTVQEFDKTPIPLEVLKQIKFSITEKHFQKIEIWADDKKPDPVVIGIFAPYYCYKEEEGKTKYLKDENQCRILFATKEEAEDTGTSLGYPKINTDSSQQYLIARFGDELKPFSELKELAINRFINIETNELQREIQDKTEKLKCIKENTISYFNGIIEKYQVSRW